MGQLDFEHYRDLVLSIFAEVIGLDRRVRLAPERSNIEHALEWGSDRNFRVDVTKPAIGFLGLWKDVVPMVEGKQWL